MGSAQQQRLHFVCLSSILQAPRDRQLVYRLKGSERVLMGAAAGPSPGNRQYISGG